jgi:hypothetical protein
VQQRRQFDGQHGPDRYQMALAYSQSMSTHGLPNFPDPIGNARGIAFRLGKEGPHRNSPVFRSAQQACQKLMPGGPP